MKFRNSTIVTIGLNSVLVGSFFGLFLVLFFATTTTEQNNGSGNVAATVTTTATTAVTSSHASINVSAFTSSSALSLSLSSHWRSQQQYDDYRRRYTHIEPQLSSLSMSSMLVKDTITTNQQRIRTMSRDELIRRIPSSPSSSSSSSSNRNDTVNTTNNAQSKYQLEFRQLLTGIIYTEEELACIRRNPKNLNIHTILTGIAASYDEPAVYRAFEILYEDYVPLRIAGRIVYKQLRKRMHEELSKNSSKRLNNRGKSAQQQQIHNSVAAVNAVDTKDSKRTKYNTRYNAMIEKFDEWKPIILASSSDATNEGTTSAQSSQRRFQILRGCFVGSDNPAVLEALRVIYVEYGALRVSGDWIFKVVSALMKPIMQRYHNQNQ